MSPRPAAPSNASMTAWARTSASECPSGPRSHGMSTPPRMNGRPEARRCASYPMPVEIAIPPPPSADRLQATFPALEHGELAHSEGVKHLQGLLVAESDVPGLVGVAGERDRAPRVEAHLQERHGRVELADRLSQPGRGDLDGRLRLRDALHRAVVEPAQVAGGIRALSAPHLHEIRVGEDVEHARRGGLAEGLEVAAPHVVGAVRVRLPDVVAVVVDRLVAEEVHGADDVVEVGALQEVREPVLATEDEVRLDPHAQVGVLAEEADVVIEVVARLGPPERVIPDGERLVEPVDVLGDAELGDPALLGDLAVAVGVGGREGLGRGGVRIVPAEMDVEVGQHGADLSRSSATRRSCAVVTLKFSGGDGTTRTTPPCASTSDASSVALARASSPAVSAASSADRRKTCGVCTAQSSERSSVAWTTPPTARLTVSCTGAAAIAASQPCSSSAASAARTMSGVTSGRAASWTTTGSPSDARSAASTECDRSAPPGTPIVPAGAAMPSGSATTIPSISSTARSASSDHSSMGRPATATSALGPCALGRFPRPAATSNATATAGTS